MYDMNDKEIVAQAALKFVKNNTIIGLGTGSTANYFIDGLAQKIKNTEVNEEIFNYLPKVEAELEKANIIVNRQLIPGDIKAGRNYFHPGGIRLGVSEITRLGMKENEMQEIATFMKQIIIEKKDPKKILPKVKSWRKEYQKVHYCFDNKLGAYEYVKLR